MASKQKPYYGKMDEDFVDFSATSTKEVKLRRRQIDSGAELPELERESKLETPIAHYRAQSPHSEIPAPIKEETGFKTFDEPSHTKHVTFAGVEPTKSPNFFTNLEEEWKAHDQEREEEPTLFGQILWFPILLILRVVHLTLEVIFLPMPFILKNIFGMDTKAVRFWDIPLERRKQTMVTFFAISLVPFSGFIYVFSFFLLIFPPTTLFMLAYIFFILRDDAPVTGKRTPFLRYWRVWRHLVNYFPMRLIKTHNLDPKGKYVFCYHPHGIISLGVIGNFATDATGFSRKFPGIDVRVLTLNINFYCPFYREFLMALGIASVTKQSCNQNLQRCPGSSILIVPGGAEESLHSKTGSYRIILRDGFIRVALENGASLVPVLGFGETDVFDCYVTPQNGFIRRIQTRFKDLFSFTIPLFHGRGFFNYSFGVMPHRKPIFVVVGKPVKVPKAPAYLLGSGLFTPEGKELVEKYRNEYKKALIELYQEFKDKLAVHRSESLQITFRDSVTIKPLEGETEHPPP